MMRVFQATLLIGAATLAIGKGSLAQTALGPSTENLLNADNDSANWILPAHSYSGNRQDRPEKRRSDEGRVDI